MNLDPPHPPHLAPLCLQGRVLRGAYKFQAVITTFEMILGGCPELNAIEWRCVIIDEAHRLKNKNCKLLEGFKLMNLVGAAQRRGSGSTPPGRNTTILPLLPGTQGPADWNSSAEHSGGAVQPAALPGACPLPLRKHLHAGVWRPQNGGAGEFWNTCFTQSESKVSTFQNKFAQPDMFPF